MSSNKTVEPFADDRQFQRELGVDCLLSQISKKGREPFQRAVTPS
jgi:hypothetical protein